MLLIVVYLCGALVTAVAAMGASIRFSDPGAVVSPRTRAAVAVLAGARWPLMAVGALQAIGCSLASRLVISAELRTFRRELRLFSETSSAGPIFTPGSIGSESPL